MVKLEFIKNSAPPYSELVKAICNYYNKKLKSRDVQKFLNETLGPDWDNRFRVRGGHHACSGLYQHKIFIDTVLVGILTIGLSGTTTVLDMMAQKS